MTRYIKRGGKVWIKIFPDKPVTAKPAETRMGSGKGALEYWVAVVKPGRVLFEISGVSEEIAREALRLATHKLPTRVFLRFLSSTMRSPFMGYSPGELLRFLSDNGLNSGNIFSNFFNSSSIVQLICCVLESKIEKFFFCSY